MTRKLQIGVMGSMADLNYSKKIEKLAEQVGFWIAKNNATLIFGAEKDSDSLSTAACRGAKRANGLTVGVTYGKGLKVYEKNADVVIASGLERGGGRELPLVLSCDAIITVGGGSGTLTEIAIAYQANIPVVVLSKTGGWSKKLSGLYLDDRKRIKIEPAKTSREAVKKALELAGKNNDKNLIFVTGVHGDEKIGEQVLRKLETAGYPVNWLCANPQATKLNKRFIDADMNRVFPGNSRSNQYEIKRAFELTQELRSYENVIDLHGTISNSGIFTIVTNPTPGNLMLAGCLPIKNVVIWPSEKSKDKGPLASFVKRGVEIECGLKNSPVIKEQLCEIIRKISLEGIDLEKSDFDSKNIFQVYGKLVGKTRKPLRDFKQATVNGETFYPLLVGQYKNVTCYKMRKVDHHNYSLAGRDWLCLILKHPQSLPERDFRKFGSKGGLKMGIRNLRLDDLGEVQRIYQAAFAGFPWYESLTSAEVASRFGKQTQLPGFQGLVATQDGLIVGAIWWESISIENLRQERGERLAEFAQGLREYQSLIWEREIIVSPSYQGRGLGLALRQKFLQRACASSQSVLILTRMRDDNLSVIRIAERCGFLRTGIKVPSSQVPGLSHEYWYYKGVSDATIRRF